MINELYELFKAINKAGVQTQKWHREYIPIRNITKNAPCVRIEILKGKVVGLSEVSQELGKDLRKFGSNQGTYPNMSLAPLYIITDDAIKSELKKLRQEDLNEDKIEQIKGWCTENNWNSKFQKKYKICMKNTPEKLRDLVPDYLPLQKLIEESNYFLDPAVLHKELETAAFQMLKEKENISLALDVLFFLGDSEKAIAKDYGSLSVAFESPVLIDMGVPAVSVNFTEELNNALLEADLLKRNGKPDSIDAFGIPFQTQIKKEPMPKVKLGGELDVKLRTMFEEQKCQKRYERIGNKSYPISPQMREVLQAALNWLGGTKEREDVTWTKTDTKEFLLVYPSELPQTDISFTRMFKRPKNSNKSFEEYSKQFLIDFKKGKKLGTDSHADCIQLFILRKIDKARTKLIYTRQTDPLELEHRSEEWTIGCSENLPSFSFGKPKVPFPLSIADILNRFWKQNGDLVTNKFKPVPQYHGMELLMEPNISTTADFHILSEKAMTLGNFLGNKLIKHDIYDPIWNSIKDLLAVMGLLLYREDIRKEIYMENLPYLYGQLLKASDELHALYCNVMRKGEFPPQFAGGSLFQSAAEMPIRTLNLLSQRIMPYYNWARSYRLKKETKEGKESWRAGWLYSVCEKITTKLHENCTLKTRFNDEEKAQLFIGYLAAFPTKEKAKDKPNKIEEDQDHE